jgi:cell division protein FtsB
MRQLEKSISDAKNQIEQTEILREQSNAAHKEIEQLDYLNSENLILRKELKNLNDNLNKFIDVIKDYKLKKVGSHKAKFTQNIPEEDRIK